MLRHHNRIRTDRGGDFSFTIHHALAVRRLVIDHHSTALRIELTHAERGQLTFPKGLVSKEKGRKGGQVFT